jgi:dUTP pyrophosphatase
MRLLTLHVQVALVLLDNGDIMIEDKLVVGHANSYEGSNFLPAINIIEPPSEIKVKYLVDFPEEYKIRYSENGDWIDLRAAKEVSLKAGEHYLIPLGIAIELPNGFEAHVVPRSSTFKNFGIIQTNHMGIIDSSYCGPNDQWFMTVLAMKDTVIHFGDRICQFRLFKQMTKFPIQEVEELYGRDRGGHGSTGIK